MRSIYNKHRTMHQGICKAHAYCQKCAQIRSHNTKRNMPKVKYTSCKSLPFGIIKMKLKVEGNGSGETPTSDQNETAAPHPLCPKHPSMYPNGPRSSSWEALESARRSSNFVPSCPTAVDKVSKRLEHKTSLSPNSG